LTTRTQRQSGRGHLRDSLTPLSQKDYLLTGIDRLTVAEIGEIEIVNENQNNTKFLVDIGAEHIEAHVDNYYEDYAVEEIPAE